MLNATLAKLEGGVVLDGMHGLDSEKETQSLSKRPEFLYSVLLCMDHSVYDAR